MPLVLREVAAIIAAFQVVVKGEKSVPMQQSTTSRVVLYAVPKQRESLEKRILELKRVWKC